MGRGLESDSCKLVDYKDDEIENLVNIDKWKIPLTYQ